MTSLGAALTIAALAIHPFLQTIPILRLRTVPSMDTASVGRATTFSSFAIDPQGADEGGNDLSTLDSASKGAVYAGLFNYTSYSTVSSNCPSGNCTWHTYTSLGVCSACNAITPESAYNPDGYDGPDYTWSLPNGLEIEPSTLSMDVVNALPAPSFKELREYIIVNLTSMYFPEHTGTYLGDSGPPPSSFECILYFCVRNYSAVVSNGVFTETLMSIFPDNSTTANDAQTAIRPSSGSSEPSPRPPGLIYDTGGGDITISPPGDDEAYNINNITFAVVRRWLQGKLQGSVRATLSSSSSLSDISQVSHL